MLKGERQGVKFSWDKDASKIVGLDSFERDLRAADNFRLPFGSYTTIIVLHILVFAA